MTTTRTRRRTAAEAMSILRDMEPRDQVRALEAYDLLTKHYGTLTTALGLRNEHFTTAAADAKRHHEAGTSNALIANAGFGHMRVMFTDEALRSVDVQKALIAWEEDE